MEELLRQIRALERRLAAQEGLESGGVWADWTPTVTQGVSVTSSPSHALYTTLGATVFLIVRLGITSAGTSGQAISISGLPAAIQPGGMTLGAQTVIGSGDVFSASAYVGVLVANGANDLRFVSDGNTGFIGATPSFGLVNGAAIGFMATYKRA